MVAGPVEHDLGAGRLSQEEVPRACSEALRSSVVMMARLLGIPKRFVRHSGPDVADKRGG